MSRRKKLTTSVVAELVSTGLGAAIELAQETPAEFPAGLEHGSTWTFHPLKRGNDSAAFAYLKVDDRTFSITVTEGPAC